MTSVNIRNERELFICERHNCYNYYYGERLPSREAYVRREGNGSFKSPALEVIQ